MGKAKSPIELLKELREQFEADAQYYSNLSKHCLTRHKRALMCKSYAAARIVRKIDDTLKDWT